jgi:transcription initiation factor TFIID subunit 9B
MPDTFEVVRLPQPHQRLAEVNFDIAPSEVIFSDDEEAGEQQAVLEEEDEDEDMEEVTETPATTEVPARDMDEDYDD